MALAVAVAVAVGFIAFFVLISAHIKRFGVLIFARVGEVLQKVSLLDFNK